MTGPSKAALELAREFVACTCNPEGNYHFATCPIRDGIDIDVAEQFDALLPPGSVAVDREKLQEALESPESMRHPKGLPAYCPFNCRWSKCDFHMELRAEDDGGKSQIRPHSSDCPLHEKP